MNDLLQQAVWAGSALVALWFYVRFPRLRPTTTGRAIFHVALSFGVFFVLPPVTRWFMSVLPGVHTGVVLLVTLVVPALCYVLLTWIWLLGRVLEEAGAGTPRGGLPARGQAG